MYVSPRTPSACPAPATAAPPRCGTPSGGGRNGSRLEKQLLLSVSPFCTFELWPPIYNVGFGMKD